MQPTIPQPDDERRARRAEQARARRALNPQAHRDANRRYREANPEKVRAARRSSRARAVYKQWTDDNRAQLNAQARARYAADPEKERARNRGRPRPDNQARQRRQAHGVGIDAAFARMWEQQGGKCYLCGIYLVPWAAYIEHDHRCCPPGKTCPDCRRGLACDYCNLLIGLADDDPELLRRIAYNLELAKNAVSARMNVRRAQ